ncbi:lipoprotein [Cupriavidus sp. HPC(L)]|uniref:COG4315 family predicted lipoprotein n=1 Tax=Cupriavidus sp. HPC(L) TaxID=1217418 RepID=UPI0002DD91C7|nr:lipoprotein [Cupriavidus sp. HPC(L)]
MTLSRLTASGRLALPVTATVTIAAAVLLTACSGMGMGSGSSSASASSTASTTGNMPPTVKVSNGVLTDPQGLTLYTFDRDTAGSGKSVCNGQCAVNWPPLLAQPGTSATGQYTIITRDDGSRQWAYRGKPLYRFAKDTKPGDRTGDKVMNVWHIATP